MPQFGSILAFERAALQTLREGRPRVVRFSVDPLPMLRALADGVLLDNPEPGDYEVEITEEGPIGISAARGSEPDISVPLKPMPRDRSKFDSLDARIAQTRFRARHFRRHTGCESIMAAVRSGEHARPAGQARNYESWV